jgi:AraC family transcriptional regulator
LLLTERAYPPGLDIPPHTHEYPYLCTVLQGGYTETCAGRVWTCTPRTLFLRPRGEPHADRFAAAGGRIFGIELGPGWSARLGPRPGALDRPAVFDARHAGLALRLYREFRTDDHAAPLIVEGLVLEILGQAWRDASRPGETSAPRWLNNARDILHDRYRQPPGLAELAGEVGVHPVHLARAFRRKFGCTVGDYVRRLRIDLACRELARPGRSLVDVALECGFCDQSQFCRTFRQLVGVTPAQFRREALGR